MEIRTWLYCVIFNCIIIKYLEAKTFSLNEAIAAESQQREIFETTLPPKSAESTGKRYSLIQRLRSPSRTKKFLKSGIFLDPDTKLESAKISPLKYKKTFLIKSPLKPKKLKLVQKSRYKRKNQSAKREINGNEKLKQKYIPLLKSLSMLFDNLLNSDASESHEVKTKKFKRNRFYSAETYPEETFGVPLNCPHQTGSGIIKYKSQEETTTSAPVAITETTITAETFTFSEITTTPTYLITTSDFSPFRQNKNIPVLLSRNTNSGRRNDHGIGERSSTPLHGNIEGNITRHHGDNEHDARCGENESCTKNYEKNTFSSARDSARGFRFQGTTGNRNNAGILPNGNRTDDESAKNETATDHIREIQFEVGGDETKSPRLLQESIRRLRGFTSEHVSQNNELVQPKEVREESILNVTHDNAGDQRVTNGSGSITAEDQKVRKRNETIIINKESFNSSANYLKRERKRVPVVMIFDGYSTARHKNGENKFSEKSIRIHS